MKQFLKNRLRQLGFDLVLRTEAKPMAAAEIDSLADFSEEERNIAVRVKPFTLTGVERIAALINAVTYITKNGIRGDFVECGVWRGGSMMAAALSLLARGDTSRSLYLYDTFEGMPPPTEHDKRYDGVSAETELSKAPHGTGVWCCAGLDDVRNNMLSTGYPEDNIRLIKGRVEQTIPRDIPEHISLLRLDTDWYESTKHELVHLFPRLDTKGVLILDDYGYWQGARKAVDDYFDERKLDVYLHRIDCTGRIMVRGA
jgi:O-methyltransferase